MQLHRLLGDKARAFADGDTLAIQVNCMEDAGRLTERVPYAIAVTIEVADPIDIKIFKEISTRIRPRIEIKP